MSGIVCLFVSISPAHANGLDDWLQKQIASIASKSTPKQSQSISIDHGSTTLVDQSNASDLVSTALNLLPVPSGSASGQSGSGTVTSSLYAIYALATKQDPLTPTLYNVGTSVNLRTLSFTFGREQQDTAPTASASSATSTSASPSASSTSTTTLAGTIYGVQWLPWNRRDATRISKDDKVMTDLAGTLTSHAVAFAKAEFDLNSVLCAGDTACENALDSSDKVDAKIKTLSKDKQTQINRIVSDYQAAVRDTAVDQKIDALVQALKQRYQFAISFQTTQRSGASPADYRGELIYDQGLGQNWLVTLNGSYNYSNSAMVGGDFRTERGAFQLSRNITNAAGAHLQTPLQFNLSAEGLRQERDWHYRAQLQLVVPISTGVDFPISFGYADQIDVLRQEEKGVYGKFGLTFDFGKIVDSIRGLK